jgi:hypothetical protein
MLEASDDDVDRNALMPVTPSISSSILVVMRRSISSAEAPIHSVVMRAVLNEMSGKKSTGMRASITRPASMHR